MQHSLDEWDIVVVSFNSKEDLESNWASQPESVLGRVIVVDNGSTDQSADVLHERVQCSVRRQNDGLSKGNNDGASRGSAKYLLFCNPDVRILPGSLLRVGEELERRPGIVAPRLTGLDGQPQENARGWPTLAAQIANRCFRSASRARPYMWPVGPDEDAEVPWVLGAAVAMRRTDFKRIGGWPEEYFLYYEDTVLCLAARAAGLSVRILGSVKWTHRWEKGSRHLFSRTAREHLRSAFRFYRQHPQFLVGKGRQVLTRSSRQYDRTDQEGRVA